jgi:uncharacterized membrane protein
MLHWANGARRSRRARGVRANPGIGPLFGPDSGATLLVLALIGLFAFGVMRLQGRSFDGGTNDGNLRRHNREPAIQILRKRYANGEISREVYLKTLDDLR